MNSDEKLTDRRALELIGSHAYDLDIPIQIRMDIIISYLKEVGIDYSYEEVI